MGLCRRVSFQHSGCRKRSMIGLVEPPRMVTKCNKMFAETAESARSRGVEQRTAEPLFMSLRGELRLFWGVVRDTGFE